MSAADFTEAAELADRLRDYPAGTTLTAAEADNVAKAADMLLLFADRINHLTNVSEGKSQAIAELRTGLAELRAMCFPDKSEANASLIAAAPKLYAACERAKLFIENGIALGFIRMPDPDTPDPAHNTLPTILAALAEARGAS